jgi:hypothetical protein
MSAVTKIIHFTILQTSQNYSVYCTLSLPNYARGRALAKHALKLSKPDGHLQVSFLFKYKGEKNGNALLITKDFSG